MEQISKVIDQVKTKDLKQTFSFTPRYVNGADEAIKVGLKTILRAIYYTFYDKFGNQLVGLAPAPTPVNATCSIEAG